MPGIRPTVNVPACISVAVAWDNTADGGIRSHRSWTIIAA